jgi:hypothetical protein
MLIAVLAVLAAFIDERMTLRRAIGLLMGVARVGRGSSGLPNRRTSTMRPRAARQQGPRIPRKRTWWAAVVSGITARLRRLVLTQSRGDEVPMIADDVVAASIT